MDPISALDGLAAQIATAKEVRAFGSSIHAALNAANEARPTLDNLERLSGFTKLVGTALSSDERQSLRAMLRDLHELGEKILKADDQEAVQESARLLTHDLRKDAMNLQSALNTAWKRLIEAEFRVIGRLGRVLRQLPETEKLGLKMQALHQQADALAGNLESAPKQSKELKRLTESREKLNNDLRDLGTGDEVVAFLVAVANQTASVANLSSKVRAWLAECHAQELFKITL